LSLGKDWRSVRIGELGAIVTGGTPPDGDSPRFVGNLPFITPTDLNEGTRTPDVTRFLSDDAALALSRRTLPAHSVCFTCIGATIGKACLTRDPAITNQQINSIVVDQSQHDPAFVYYRLVADRERIKAQAGGAATPIISKGSFKQVIVAMPPLPTQRKVAAILSAYDDLIENNNRRIKLLEEMAQRIYREWFVDFRYPGHESVPLVDSELGPIPEEWAVRRLGDVVELIYGKALKAGVRRNGPVNVFGSGGLIGHHDQSMVDGPGIIVGRKGNVGSIHWSNEAFFAIDTTYWVRSSIPLTYCYYALDEMEFLDSHAAVPGLSREQAYSLPLLIPASDSVARFDRIISEVFAFRHGVENAIATLRSTRDLLLPRLISGEVDVTDLNIAIPDEAA